MPAAVLMCLLISVLLFSGCSSVSHETDFAPSQERQLVVYTSHKEEVYGPIIAEFERRTGIWVRVVTGGTTTLLDRIREEKGIDSADVMFGGGVDTLSAYTDCFEPYRCSGSDCLNTAFRSETDSWTAFSSLPIVIVYNNKLVYVNSVPTGWKDLMDERWRGKIAYADPANSGTGYTSLATLIQVFGTDSEETTMEDFARVLDGKILSASGEVLDAVASGSKLVGITLEEAALKRSAAGADISIVYPVEGTSAVPDGSALVKGAVHSENAKLFLDFIIDSDIQRMLADSCCRRPVRGDVTVDPDRFVDIDEIDYDLEWAGSSQGRILDIWNSLKEVENETD